ncbi:hypothetical protein [Mediterraneibacter massiliensis]|uniref:hypothetical protein n=1 Tax=Mediterraneibacter massiliensis TaxID=1720300 RepID=UPI0024AD632F|nr:hypothetical protein [Mediterraneibacter massiliensis]
MEHTDMEKGKRSEKIKNMQMYSPIREKIRYWRKKTKAGDLYRQKTDLDCILTDGNLNADTIFSLWLPLRYVLNHFACASWEKWKEYEYEELKPKKVGLKEYPEFLNDLLANMEEYLPAEKLTALLSVLFDLGQQRCNVMILPYRAWNRRRGEAPYWEYLPHFLYDLLRTDSPIFLQAMSAWIRSEHLEMFFMDERLEKESLKDLAGTGMVWKHAPKNIDLEKLLTNYIAILKERKKRLSAAV